MRPRIVGSRAVRPATVSESAGTMPSGTFFISESASAKYASGRCGSSDDAPWKSSSARSRSPFSSRSSPWATVAIASGSRLRMFLSMRTRRISRHAFSAPSVSPLWSARR